MSKVSVALWSFRSNYEHEMHDTLRRFIDIVRIKYCNGDGSLDSACWRTSSFLATGLWCRVQDVSDDEGEIIEINAATSAA